MTDWARLYNRSSKPKLEQIRAFMDEDAFEALSEFNKVLLDRFNLGYVLPRYTQSEGWTYAYGRSGCICVSKVAFYKTHFTVGEIQVSGPGELPGAIRYVEELFHNGFLQKYAEYDEERTKRRMLRAQLRTDIDETVYKKNCIWPAKVSRNDLRRLYQSDAAMMTDAELLDDIGLTLSVRCQIASALYDLLATGPIKCMARATILAGRGALPCGCGRAYTYHAYRKAYREDNMPRGAASETFDRFVADWESAASAGTKMRLIDGLIHAFHIAAISGKRGRPVGVNLIQETKKQIIDLIEELSGN